MSSFAPIEKSFEHMKNMETTITNAIGIVNNIIEELKTVTESNITDATIKHTEEVKKAALKCIEMDQELKEYTETINQMKRIVRSNSEFNDLEKMFQDTLNSVHSQNNTNCSNDPRYQNLLAKISEWQNSANASSQETNEDPDADLLLTQQTIMTICPISRQEMIEPMKNKICNHTYEKSSILTLIKQRKGKAMCPIPGCKNRKPVKPDDLVLNFEVKNYIMKQKQSI